MNTSSYIKIWIFIGVIFLAATIAHFAFVVGKDVLPPGYENLPSEETTANESPALPPGVQEHIVTPGAPGEENRMSPEEKILLEKLKAEGKLPPELLKAIQGVID